MLDREKHIQGCCDLEEPIVLLRSRRREGDGRVRAHHSSLLSIFGDGRGVGGLGLGLEPGPGSGPGSGLGPGPELDLKMDTKDLSSRISQPQQRRATNLRIQYSTATVSVRIDDA